jgi:hypothetical protein
MDWEKNLSELQQLSGRLDEACRKLWDEDRVAAVPLQALADEIKLLLPDSLRALKELGAVSEKSEARAAELADRLEQAEERLAENTARAEAGHAVPRLEQELKLEKERTAVLREEVKAAKARAEAALGETAAKEEELNNFKERHLRADAQKDAERTQKNADLLAGIEKKELELEDAWTRRHKALEAEQKERQDGFEKRHRGILEALRENSAGLEKAYMQKEARLMELNKRLVEEFQDREARTRAVEEELRARTSMLESSAAALAKEYEEKQAAIEALKKRTLAALAEGAAAEEK